jgi:hypothetical protein
MFERVTLHASDRAASVRFYETVLPAVGGNAWGDFAVAEADGEHPVTNRLHLAFFAASHADVDAFWRAGTEAGYRDDGAPGPRPEYGPDYYGGFLLDPDGNSAEAVHHDRDRVVGRIDHLWIRVADVAAARAFYERLAPEIGFSLGTARPERVQFRGDGSSFSLVAGEPSEHVNVAFAGASPRTETDPDGNLVEIVAR